MSHQKKSNVIVEHLRRIQMQELLVKGERLDGRGLTETRPLKIETNIIQKANGSARVTLGNTQVIAGVKIDTGEPYGDRPNEGIMICGAEVLPLASAYSEPGPPDEDAVELARVVDRGIRESEMIDVNKLVLTKGKVVYKISVDVSILNIDGNLFDAASYAAASALLTAKLPKFKIEDGKVVDTNESTSTPTRTIPVSVTMAKIGDIIITDPTYEEESIMDGRVTMTTDAEGNVCAVQKGGTGTFTVEQINHIVETTITKGNEIRSILKKATENGSV
ncbi:MAG: exosome complex protein Rrp42 [Thaumarchaeota archaeon]|nr:exosome complex protein Rrp42 [Nitrososphaerota archaeon]